MKIIKGLIFKIIAVAVGLVALLVASENSEEVSLTFLKYSTPEWPISWWVLAAFLLGVATTWILNIWTNTSLRLAARKASSEVQKTNQTMDKARADLLDESELNSSG